MAQPRPSWRGVVVVDMVEEERKKVLRGGRGWVAIYGAEEDVHRKFCIIST